MPLTTSLSTQPGGKATEPTGFFEIYKEKYWPKHHFANDALLTARRFTVANADLFDRVSRAGDIELFTERISEIARHYRPEPVDVREYGFFNAMAPLAKYVREEIDKQVSRAKGFIAPTEELLIDISNQLNFYLRNEVLGKILVNELHFSKEANMLAGDTDEQQFAYFVLELTAKPEWIDYFFEEYPLAAYKAHITIKNACRNAVQLLLDLQFDKQLLQTEFGLPDSTLLNSMSLSAGDTHQQGKAVILLNFTNGTKLLYKPREVSIDNAFGNLIRYLNELGFNLPYKEIKSVVVNGHSWVEFIPYEPCRSLNEVKDYFVNIGSMLALFYLLGSKDIIADNIIAHGSLPCFIDLELLINKAIPQDYALNYPYEVLKVFLESVYSVGMLPSWAKSGGRTYDSFMGGIISLENQKVMRYGWQDKLTSNMSEKLLDTFLSYNRDNHLPEFDGKRYAIEDCYPEFRSGFLNTCEQFIEKRHLIDPVRLKSVFTGTRNRVILRETMVYDVLKKESHHPKYMESKLNSLFLYDSLWCSFAEGRIEEAVISSEMLQLAAEDIPYFYTTEGSHALYDGNDQVVDAHFFKTASAVDAILNRLSLLTTQEISIQLSIIEGMAKVYYENNKIDFFDKNQYIKLSPNIGAHAAKITKQEVLALSNSIAQEICAKMLVRNNEVSWLTKGRFSDSNNFSYAPISSDLYEGSVGIAFFLLYLSKYFPNNNYTSFADSILTQGKKEFYYKVEKQAFDINYYRLKNQINPSPYAFPTATLYLMDHFAHLHGNQYWDEPFALAVCSWISEYTTKDSPVDFLNGLAGVVILLLNIYARTRKEEFLKVAIACGDAIVQQGKVNETGAMHWTFQDSSDLVNPIKSLGGFAHGSAGIMFALFRLSQFSGSEAHRIAAIRALQFDREQFIPTLNGWRDGRTDELFDSASWCHGSAGIGLSRLLIRGAYRDDYLKDELTIAAANILSKGLNNSHCLCHGDLGDLEILRALLTGQPAENDTRATIRTYLKQYIAQASQGKQFRCGTGGDLELLGAFVGKAGIGYNLLRLAEWEHIPSLLCLESPLLNEACLHQGVSLF